MEVELFIPCIIDQFYPQTALNMVKILEEAGVKVYYNSEQTCCGQYAYNNGYWKDAKVLGEKFINEMNSGRYVVSPSVSCVSTIKDAYPDLFLNTAMHNEFRHLQGKIFEICDFLVNVIKVKKFHASFNHKVAYISSGSTKGEYSLINEPVQLLHNVKDIELIEITDSICESGGSFSFKFEPIAVSLVKSLVEKALNKEISYITTTEPHCLLQLDSYIKKNNLSLKTIHIIDILANGW